MAKLESTVSSVDYQRGILSELSSIRPGTRAPSGRGVRAEPRGHRLQVELPWGKPEGQGRKFSPLLTTRLGNASR